LEVRRCGGTQVGGLQACWVNPVVGGEELEVVSRDRCRSRMVRVVRMVMLSCGVKVYWINSGGRLRDGRMDDTI